MMIKFEIPFKLSVLIVKPKIIEKYFSISLQNSYIVYIIKIYNLKKHKQTSNKGLWEIKKNDNKQVRAYM